MISILHSGTIIGIFNYSTLILSFKFFWMISGKSGAKRDTFKFSIDSLFIESSTKLNKSKKFWVNPSI